MKNGCVYLADLRSWYAVDVVGVSEELSANVVIHHFLLVSPRTKIYSELHKSQMSERPIDIERLT